MPDSLATLKEQHSRLRDIWHDCHHYRADQWDPLIRRKAPQNETVPLLAQYAMGVDVQSPDLEKALNDWLSAQLLELTKIDAFSLDNHEKAKRDVEDIRIVLAGSWGQQNDKKAISRAAFTMMNRYGLACFFKPWNMPTEPDLEGVEGKDAEDKRDKYWDDYYAEDDNCPFGYQKVSPLEITFWPLEKPELVFQESKIKYLYAKELSRDASLGGGKLTLDKLKKIAFVGDNEPIDEWQADQSDAGGPEVYVLKRAYLDKATKRWKWDCWVRVDGQEVNESAQLEGGDVPYDRCPYFFIASGDEQVTETDPHLRFRPKIYPLLVDVQELNALESLLVQCIVMRIQFPYYARFDGLDPQMLQAFQAMEGVGLGIIEGQGAESRFLIRHPEPGSSDILTAPALEAMPVTDIEVLRLRIEQKRMDILTHSPNRFLIGNATEKDMAGSGTGLLNQAQAAQTTVHGDLENFDAFVEDWLSAECEAWVYWDEGAEVQKPRKYRIHGDEPVTKNPREAGDEVFINAEKLKRPFVLAAHTSNMTQQERALEDQSADVAYQQGAITKSMWLKKRGADDPEKLADDLWRDQQDRRAEMLDQPLYDEAYRRFISMFTDMAPPTVPMAEGQEGQQAGPGGQMPPQPKVGIHNGTAAALGAPQGSSNGTPPGVR